MVNSLDDCKHYPGSEKSYKGWTYIEPTEKHEYTVMMLHGLAGTSDFHKPDFEKAHGEGYDPKQRVVLP